MFSVVIPAFNCEDTICEVLDSVRNQTRADLIQEVIIVNDGSTDKTDAAIVNYMAANPEFHIIYIQQTNQGVSKTRNRAIRMAKAEWVALLDSDDLWKKDKIEKQYNILKENENIVFTGSYVPLKFWFKKHEGLYKLNARELCVRSMPFTSSSVFRKDMGMKHGLFNEEMSFCEDINFFQKFLLDDSYYVLAEELVEMSYSKKYFAQKGLSSRLYEMHKGRNHNVKELHEMGLISTGYMYTMLIINEFKFLRRYIQQKINKLLFRIGNVL